MMPGCSFGSCSAGIFDCTLAPDVGDLGSRRDYVTTNTTYTVAGAVQRRKWR